MCRRLHYCIILISSSVFAKEPELPLCPANFQFLPQQLPLHCRLPTVPHPMASAPFPAFYPGPNPDRLHERSQAIPIPPIPGFPPPPPGFPPGAPPGLAPPPPGFPSGAPHGLPPGVPPGFPPMMPPGMPIGMPMPMPGAPSAKLPVIVMPFYSPDPAYKQASAPNLRPRPNKRRIRKRRDSSSTETDTSSSDTDSSDSDIGWWKKRSKWSGRRNMEKHRRRRHKKNRQNLLTPVLQYVNKDGYVIYEKQISEGEAKGWLGPNSKQNDDEGTMALELPDLTKAKSHEEEKVIVDTTQAPQETPVVQIKIKKKTVKKHHHHKPNRLIEQPVTTQEDPSH